MGIFKKNKEESYSQEKQDLQIKTPWNEWEITELIGEGSFGKVYKAKREVFGNIDYCAIKILTIPQNESEIKIAKSEGMNDYEVKEYFKGLAADWIKEIKLMESLKDAQNIVGIEDYRIIEKADSVGWDIFIRMELLTSFPEFMEENTLTKKEIIKLGIDISYALDYCQKIKIIHRDIKPENIFVTKFGDFKLGDFGIAREVEKTTSGLSKKGTYSYMAPEVYLGGAYNASVDTYSLGIVLYRFLNNNRTPFLPEYPKMITFNDREEASGRRFSGEKLLPPANAGGELSDIILKACAFNPKDRFESAAQMRQALESVYQNISDEVLAWSLKNPAEDINSDKTESVRTGSSDVTESVVTGRADMTESIRTGSREMIYDEEKEKKNQKKHKLIFFGSIAAALIIILSLGIFLFYNHGNKGTDIAKAAESNIEYVTVKNVVGTPVTGANEILSDMGLVVTVKEVVDDSKVPGTVLAQSIKADEKVKKGTKIELTAAVSSQKIKVPDLNGKNKDQAIGKLTSLGLNGNFIEQYSDTVPENIIISQATAAGTMAAKGTTIDFLISKGKEFQIVPDVTGMNETDARQMLSNLSFIILEKQVINDSKTAGTVLSQSVKAGTKLKTGGTVQITVAVSSQKVTVPNVTGKTETQAAELLTGSSLTVSKSTAYSDTIAKGIVISQGTASGTKVYKGTTVKIVVSLGKSQWSAWEVSLPSYVNSTQYYIEEKTQYSYSNKSYTTSSSGSLSGWTLYNTTSVWGPWSAWSSTAYTATANRNVNTRTVTDQAAYVLYNYYFYRYYNTSVGKYLFTYANVSGSTKYTTSSKTAFKYYNTYDGHAAYLAGGIYFSDELWFLASTQNVPAVTHTEYQYQDKIFTYYFYKWESWSAWQDTAVSATSDRRVQTRKLYRYRAR